MDKHRRMWEAKGHRPYWAAIHIQMLGPKFKELTGFEYTKTFFTIDEHGHAASYFSEAEMAASTRHFAKQWFSDWRNKFFDFTEAFYAEADKRRKEVFSLDWKQLSDDEIIAMMQEIEAKSPFRYIFITNPQHVEPIETRLRELLADHDDPNKVISAITTCDLPLPFDDELNEIAELRKQWASMSEKERIDALQHLVTTYGWFGGIEGEAPYDEAHYEQEILNQPEEHTAITSIDVPDEVRELGQFIARLGNIRFWGRYHGMSMRYCIRLCLEELGRRWNRKDMLYLTVPEAASAKTTDYTDLIAARKQGYIAKLEHGKPALITGKDAQPYLDAAQEEIPDTDQFTGKIANPGKVRGRARIISFASDDYHKQVAAFKKGEILVTGMTRPQIAHLCHKSSAIITDEGGVTSHAAIISRECNVPCVIGTHFATKIIKTGDLVEVDATNGVVRIIKEDSLSSA